jgi:hypothetical protein
MAEGSGRIALLLAVLLAFLCSASTVSGSWVGVEPDLEGMVENSELILTGKVVYITPFETGGIFRDASIEIEMCLKGSPNASTLDVRIYGGESYWSSIPNANFTVGERVLVFLMFRDGNYRVINGPWGKYLLIDDAPYPLDQVREIIANQTGVPIAQVGAPISTKEDEEEPAIIDRGWNFTWGFYGVVGLLAVSFIYVIFGIRSKTRVKTVLLTTKA